MNPNPKSSQYKFAFTGTNCSGKTTMALDITSRLKHAHILAEVVCSQDRKITWKDDHFPVNYKAHYGMITNLIHAEVQAELKGDAQVVITDRSVLDLYAIACYDHPESQPIKDLEQMILAWCKSYTKIYYLPPFEYQADGKRPSNDFRMATHAKLKELMAKYNLPNVVEMPRSEIFKDITSEMGVVTPKAIFMQQEKWQYIANAFKVTILVKAQKSPVSSDLDAWVVADPELPVSNILDIIRFHIEQLFGYPCDLMTTAPITDSTKIDFEHQIYSPTNL